MSYPHFETHSGGKPCRRILLFDIDGTLFDTGGKGAEAFAHAGRSAFGIENGTQHLVFAGATDLALVNQFLDTHHLEQTPAHRELFLDHYQYWLGHILAESRSESGCQPLPGVESLLESISHLCPDMVLGLVTGNTRLGAEIKLRHYRIWHHFSVGGFGCENADRRILAQKAWQRVPHTGDRSCWLVGDTLNDLQAAQAIGSHFIGFCSGKTTAENFLDHGANLAIQDYSDFPYDWFI